MGRLLVHTLELGDVEFLVFEVPTDTTAIPASFGLTPRERAIASLVSRGDSTEQVCTHSQISRSTLSAHLSRIFHKCKVNSRLELVSKLNTRRSPTSTLTEP